MSLKQPIHLIQITDLHIAQPPRPLPDSTRTTEETLKAVLRAASAKPAKFWLCTGDLANDPDPAAYRQLDHLFGNDGCPIYCLPGNHDDPQMAREAIDNPRTRMHWDKRLDLGPWQILMLDSHVPGRIDGGLASSELAFLDKCLAENPGQYALVCLHHHPVPVGSAWLDNHILKDAEEFFAVIERHPKVKCVVWGHVHQCCHKTWNNVELLGTPSTCFQFLPHHHDFAFDTRPPAYRSFTLMPDGSFTTDVVFVELTL